MPAPLSQDLRERIVRAYNNGEGGFRTIAKRFDVHFNTVQSLVNLAKRQGGDLTPKKLGGANNIKLTPSHIDIIRRLHEEDPSATQQQIADLLFAETGVRVRNTAICYHAKKLGLTFKKRHSKRQSS